jgi:iron(III) transport system substrate-binding protein
MEIWFSFAADVKKLGGLMFRSIASGALLSLAVSTALTFATDVRAQQGNVIVYTSHAADTTGPVLELLKQRLPNLNITLVRAGTGEVLQRLKAEASNAAADVMWGGSIQLFEGNADLFQPFVSNDKDQFAVHDPANLWHASNIIAIVIGVNTKKVAASDMPTSTAGALDAKYTPMGGIALPEPSKSSTGYTVTSALAGAQGWPFVERIAKTARVLPSSGGAANAARDGEIAMCWVNEDVTAKWEKEGLAIKSVYPTDGVPTVVDAQAMVKGAKNLDNAKAFMSFLNTKEVHEVTRDKVNRRSARKDVTPPVGLPDLGNLKLIFAVEPASVVNARFDQLRK